MEETQCCHKCGIGFKQVGLLSLEERLENHQRLPHVIECAECEDTFISHTHLRYHIETQHDARCGDCRSFCNRTCSIQYATVTELTATWGDGRRNSRQARSSCRSNGEPGAMHPEEDKKPHEDDGRYGNTN